MRVDSQQNDDEHHFECAFPNTKQLCVWFALFEHDLQCDMIKHKTTNTLIAHLIFFVFVQFGISQQQFPIRLSQRHIELITSFVISHVFAICSLFLLCAFSLKF
jgi:hypothetical protein